MKHLPDTILARLGDSDSAVRLEAVAGLSEQGLTLAAVTALGKLAANDPDPQVRGAALKALRSEAAQAVYAHQAMPGETRQQLLRQVQRWHVNGLISAEQAEVLRLRYGFEPTPAPLPEAIRKQMSVLISRWAEQALITGAQASALTASLVPPAAAPAAPAPAQAASAAPARQSPRAEAAPKKTTERPASPAPSLSQILFSETSIRIALFLGGFLVVAAALILAALVEVARLPVLLGLAAVSGAGAVLSRRRLPLPSFVLYIIFASLLPILARVVVDLLHLTGQASDAYWSAAWLLLALALAAGTRLYSSRLMSWTALGGLAAAGFEMAALIQGDWRALGLMLALVAVCGALGAAALRRWKDFRFALPLYLGAHLAALAALLFNAGRILLELISLEESAIPAVLPENWLYFAAAWAAAAAFYVTADGRVRRLGLLPYLAAGALLFFPATLAQAVSPEHMALGLIIAGWGAVYALGGAALDQHPRAGDFAARYGKPLMFGAPFLFAWAAPFALDADIHAGLALLLASAVVLAVLNLLRQRRWAWVAGLLFGLLAYFVLFELEVVERLNINGVYITLLPGLLLLLPDFFTLSPEAERRWRMPARWVGLLLLALFSLAIPLLLFPGDPSEHFDGAVAFTIIAAFFLALALVRGRPLLSVVTTVYLPAAMVLLLSSLEAERGLPWFAALAALFYGVGWAVRHAGEPGWSSVFRRSGLALGLLLALFLPVEHDWVTGLSILAMGGLFLVERLWGPRFQLTAWLEVPMDVLLAAALFGLLDPLARLDEHLAWALGLFIAALIVLGVDLFFTRAAVGQPARPFALRWGARGAGSLLALGSVLYNITAADLPAGWAAALFLASAGYGLLSAFGYRLPRLGYAVSGFLALALFYLLRAWKLDFWLAPEVALAALLYAGSFLLARTGKEPEQAAAAAWTEVLRYSGLVLALLVSLTAPLEESGLWASLWVACAATLFAVEAFRRRSVWWGFPTDGLYLLAYFLLLIDLRVDQPQFFSAAVAVLGMLQHYLLIRTGSRVAAFITGMVSQLILLGTTYFQMTSTEQLGYFVILFFQGLAVLVYGVILRSRSLVITPLVFIVLGVMTVVLSILSGVPTAIIIGCTGILLLTLGILAVVLRERLVEASEKMGGWRA